MSTRESVLAALRREPGGLSGELLASELGVSRVAVSKHVSALRSEGYEIDARAGEGYRLVSSPDEATPAEVAPLVGSGFWTRFDGGRVLPSTNDRARELAREGAEEGTVVLAASQSAGRGRLGRTWESPGGGVYCSMVLRPTIAPAQAGPLALVVGLGVARGLATLDAEPMLKWPNDVWLQGRKVAGILLEMSAEHDRIDWIVAGVGLNVDTPQDLPGAAGLRETVPGCRAAVAAAAMLDGVASAYADWRRVGFAGLAEEYAGLDALAGEAVTVSTATGEVLASGVARGVDPEGRLLVLDGDTTVPVFAGEVTLRT